jgi:Bacterial Ig-like domain (group 3)
MNKLLRSIASVAVVASFAGGALVMGFAGSASASGPIPPWEPVANPPEVGGLLFFNAAAQQISGGSLSAQPLAAYVEGTTTIQAGDTKATLYGYLPVNGQTPGEWSGEAIGASTAYPNGSAPPPLKTATLPVETGGSADESVSILEADLPNTDTSSDGYANMYVLRLLTTEPEVIPSTSYDSADIEVNNTGAAVNGIPADSWVVVYPAVTPAATTTTLTTVPPSPQVSGTSVALNATVTPSAPGTVQFEVGGTDIGAPVVVSGGKATFSTSSLPVGTDALSAVFTPATFAAYKASTGTTSFTVTAAPVVACTFNGDAGPATLTTGITPGAAVAISCTGTADQTYYAEQASLLGDIAVNPATAAGETDSGSSIALTETPPTTGTTYTAAFTVPNPWPTTSEPPSDPNAVCPVSPGQFNAGIVGCEIEVVTSAKAAIPDAHAVIYYSTQTASPNSPTVALPPGSVSPGQHITFSDASGACPLNPTASSRCWWGDAFGISSTSAGSVSVSLDGKAVAGATATISGPGDNGSETWNGTTLSPDALRGSLTLPTTLSAGEHTLTVTEHNTTEFDGNGTAPSAGSVLTASVEFDVLSAQGYWLACANGSVFAAGAAPTFAQVSTPASDPVVGMTSTPGGKGYWLVTANGTIFTAGDAKSYGSLPQLHVTVSNIVAIASTGDGGGYWLIGRDGGEFAFGDAKYHGSLPGLGVRVTNIVGMVATSNGGGYWLVGSDGGVFAFGNTHYVGSLPGLGVHVNDIRAMIPSPTAEGYDLVGADGGVFVFGGGVHYYGSLPGEHISVDDIVGLALTPPDLGYWFAGSDGNVYPFGDAENLHPSPLIQNNLPVVAIAVS